jgi:hypothetical protein
LRPLKPLAIGLLQHPPGASPAARRQARISLTAQAPRHGFAIAEVYELDGNPVADDAAVGALLRLAARTAARTVLTAGPLDRDRAADLTRHRQLHLVPTDLHSATADGAKPLAVAPRRQTL